jgi:osmotically-inducible protein OsmY
MNAMRLAVAFAAGAAAMYFFDPVTGRRRRALVRDRGVSAGHGLQDFVKGKAKHTADRLHGAIAEARARRRDAPVSDDLLEARIRSEIGHLVQRASAVTVAVQDGDVVLGGRARASEINELVEHVAGMRGVGWVENQLGAAGRTGQQEAGVNGAALRGDADGQAITAR